MKTVPWLGNWYIYEHTNYSVINILNITPKIFKGKTHILCQKLKSNKTMLLVYLQLFKYLDDPSKWICNKFTQHSYGAGRIYYCALHQYKHSRCFSTKFLIMLALLAPICKQFSHYYPACDFLEINNFLCMYLSPVVSRCQIRLVHAPGHHRRLLKQGNIQILLWWFVIKLHPFLLKPSQ